jgi:hypothetical protein
MQRNESLIGPTAGRRLRRRLMPAVLPLVITSFNGCSNQQQQQQQQTTTTKDGSTYQLPVIT